MPGLSQTIKSQLDKCSNTLCSCVRSGTIPIGPYLVQMMQGVQIVLPCHKLAMDPCLISLCAHFLDVQKAYNTVWRDGLWFKLWDMGVMGKMWRVVKGRYLKVLCC